LTFTYDPTTDIGRVRREIPYEKVLATSILTDEEIQSYLDDEGDDWRLAAAQALDYYANNFTLILQNMSDSGYSISGVSMAADFRARAMELRKQSAEGGIDDTGSQLDIITLNREDWI
jgi:hypothetical protein